MSSKAFACCLIPFVILATLNAGGYRYGASDQAFYQPAVLAQLDPQLFPRDADLIAAQATLTTYDEVIATIVRVTGASVPSAFAALYVVSLLLIAAGTWLIARRLYTTAWAGVALLAAMTLRHAVARSGTNTLEGYFHPRQIAYGLGLLAVAAFLRGRFVLTSALVLAAGAVHPTAALWFAVWLGAAAAIAHPAARRVLMVAAVPVAAVAAWAFASGPLAGRLAVMDDEWLRMLETKDYLFIWGWPLYAWVFNLGYLAVIAVMFQWRRAAGLAGEHERALVLGSLALVVVFVVALVTQALHLVLAFQLQPARLFLIFDFMATAYAVWVIAELPRLRGPAYETHVRRPGLSGPAVAAVILFSVVRGAYVVQQADRPLVQVGVADDDWGRVMAWAKTTDKGSAWVADPMHAILYGTSVRVAGERDVFVEGVKDAALGIYDRRIAVRTAERLREVDDFPGLTTDQVRALAAKHALDYLVTESIHALPVAFESGALHVYRLR
jgi:hypothetical protein